MTDINVPETEFRGDIFVTPNIYLTRTLKELPLSFGIGVNAQYPLVKRWSANRLFRDEGREASNKPLDVNPTVSYLFGRINLPVSFGADFRECTVSNAIQTGSYNNEAHLFTANITPPSEPTEPFQAPAKPAD